ncbi:uncharacterized protein LOC123535215 [Mercenaria mercenaria]|uniref:uncharacterized protein LOC123535215 n=1 Tax=Mercenaria mercenaria TaxID=6596 RepID=UPI00234F9991|nr:uncharacterized protein LOC123535215 [Mercenaria mercenaria]
MDTLPINILGNAIVSFPLPKRYSYRRLNKVYFLQRACSGVTEIEGRKTTSIQQTDLERLQNDTRKIQERVLDTDKKLHKNIDCLEEQRDDILTKIEDVERSLIEHIQKLKRETINTLNKDFTSTKEGLNSKIDLIAFMKKDIENASSQLQSFTRMDARQQFFRTKLIRNTINDTVNLFGDIEEKGSKALWFKENANVNNSVMIATSLGHVTTVTENEGQNAQRICKVKGKKEVNIKMQNDRKTCNIYDVCQLQDGTIMLADSDNNKFKRLDMNYNIKDHCDLGDSPRSICCTGPNEVAVKMKTNKVQFISVGSSLSKLRVISIEDGYFIGMAYCDEELWISTGRGVNVYSKSGTLLKTISQDINGRNIFKSNTRHTAASGETFIVTDDCDGAVCLGRGRTVQRELRNERLVSTKGVCTSSDGTVFLSGYSSNNIVMFDKDGKCFGELVSKDDGLVNPISLCYEGMGNFIIVTCASSDKVIIFDLSN